MITLDSFYSWVSQRLFFFLDNTHKSGNVNRIKCANLTLSKLKLLLFERQLRE